jgi:predicted GNAT family N-acyltransferase
MTLAAEAGICARPNHIRAAPARSLDDLMRVMCIRSTVFMGEQTCPYDEEFDGNDFVGATHILAWVGDEPAGTMRLRWFANFSKVERVSIRRDFRGGPVACAMIDLAVTLSARKGYRQILGHIQRRLVPFWARYGKAFVRTDRPGFTFSDHEYVEVIREIEPDENALSLETDAMVLLRPEGEWDFPGVLDRSARRPATNPV